MTYRQRLIVSLLLLVMYSPALLAASGPHYLFNRADFPTGQSPTGVAIADFNGDGIADVAVANEADNTVSILLGQSDGTLGPKTDFATANAPVALDASDLNGDGKTDLVVVSTGGFASVLLGNGDGTFSAHVDYPVGSGSYGVVIADFNGDKIPDVATIDFCGTTCGFVSVILGKGDGSFLPKTDYAAGQSPGSIVAQDFNSDGKMDLAVANGSNTVSVLLGNGDGTFQNPVASPSNDTPIGLAAGDFNGDKIPDLIVSHSGAPWPLTILIGNGDGTFQPERQIGTPTGVYDTYDLAAADLNGDGKLDLVITDVSQGGAVVFLGNGDGTFQPESNYATSGSSAFAIEDINGDGSLDLVVTNQYGNTITVLLGNGDGTFSPRTSLPLGPVDVQQTNSIGASVADFNGDGIPDLALAEGNQDYLSGSVMVLLGKGKGQFQSPVITNSNGALGVIATADFNGDGRIDVALPNGRGAAVLLGNGDGGFGAPLQVVTTLGTPARFVVTGDFNNDGKQDVVVLANGFTQSQPIFILLGKGDGTFQPAMQFWNSTSIPIQMAAADFNHDGKLDLVVDLNPNGIAVMLGNGDGTFQTPVTYATDNLPNGLAIADVNGDGIPDILATADNVDLFLGKGDGTFANAVELNGGSFPQEVITADVNGDGKLDIIAAAEGTAANGSIEILLGNGDGTFQAPVEIYTGGSGLLAIGDLNQDGTADVVATGYPGALFLSGPIATLSPVPVSFGSVGVSSTGQQNLVLVNSGNAPLDVSTITATLGFAAQNPCTNPIAQSVSCTMNVTFTPSSAGGATGTLTISDNAPRGKQVLPLLGTGSDFSETPASSSIILSGAQGTDVIAFAGVSGAFNSTIQLSCAVTGPVPSPTCALSPTSVNPGASSVTSTLTVTMPTTAAVFPTTNPQLAGFLFALCLPLAGAAWSSKPKLRLRPRLLILASGVLVFLSLLTACGGSSNAGSGGGGGPTHYTVTVTGAAGSTQHSVQVSVTN